jgi:hypothetical protein
MYSLWYFVYRGDFQQVAVGAKKGHRRQKEGTKNDVAFYLTLLLCRYKTRASFKEKTII